MNKKDAKEKIYGWFDLPQKLKDRNWDSVLPYINKYPEIYYERQKDGKKRTNQKNQKVAKKK